MWLYKRPASNVTSRAKIIWIQNMYRVYTGVLTHFHIPFIRSKTSMKSSCINLNLYHSIIKLMLWMSNFMKCNVNEKVNWWWYGRRFICLFIPLLTRYCMKSKGLSLFNKQLNRSTRHFTINRYIQLYM